MKTEQEENNQPELQEDYEKPQIEVIEIETEGILCDSVPLYPDGGSAW